jgi:hypothetical protein
MCYLHLSWYFGIPGYSHSWFVPENRELGFKGLRSLLELEITKLRHWVIQPQPWADNIICPTTKWGQENIVMRGVNNLDSISSTFFYNIPVAHKKCQKSKMMRRTLLGLKELNIKPKMWTSGLRLQHSLDTTLMTSQVSLVIVHFSVTWDFPFLKFA